MVNIPEEEGKAIVRGKIFKILQKYEIPSIQAREILNQCASYIKNCGVIENAAKEFGIKLSGFH